MGVTFYTEKYTEDTEDTEDTENYKPCLPITNGLPKTFIEKLLKSTFYHEILNICKEGGYYWNGDDVFRETNSDLCNKECEPGYYCEPILIEAMPDSAKITPNYNRRECPKGHSSNPGSKIKDDCFPTITCSSGEYVKEASNGDLLCEQCPLHFTSDDKNTSDIASCYMDPKTQFCDKDNKCQTLAQIFGNDAKIYYKEQ